jgi:inosine-uridine nucleoside N-ribohydrolase
MFNAFFGLAGLAVTALATVLGYWQAKVFTQNKLRFVDSVHKASVPVLAGVAAAVVATPIVWILPIVGTGTALLFGAGVALGVNAGARDIRRRIGAG